MKRSAVIGILILVILAVIVFFGSFAVTYLQMKKNLITREDDPPALEAASQEEITSDQTEYVMETYDIKTSTISEESAHIPVQYIGCTREEITDQLADYNENPSIEDLEAGFMDFSLVYFSPERIVLRKNYNSDHAGYKYCILSERGLLTVYYIDRKTVYEYTSIETSSLPNDVRLQVVKGLYFKDLSEVFDFLESHSS